VIATAIAGMTVATGLWWTYFDWTAIVMEQRLRLATGQEQAVLARDAYSYLHFVMVAGIVFFAVGVKATIHDYGSPLSTVFAAELCCGLALYLLAHVLFRYRISRTIGRGRSTATVVLVACWPLAVHIPALASLYLVAAVFVGLVAYEALFYRESRSQIRHGALATEDLMAGPRRVREARRQSRRAARQGPT
jgi:low temperature requirement protein LtrA